MSQIYVMHQYSSKHNTKDVVVNLYKNILMYVTNLCHLSIFIQA